MTRPPGFERTPAYRLQKRNNSRHYKAVEAARPRQVLSNAHVAFLVDEVMAGLVATMRESVGDALLGALWRR